MRLYDERSVLSDEFGSVLIRILKVCSHENKVWVYDMLDKHAWPRYERMSDLDRACETQNGYKLASSGQMQRVITPKMRKRALKMYDVLKDALADEPAIFTKAGRVKWLQILQKDYPSLGHKTYGKYLRAWFAGGKIPELMTPGWDSCGATVPLDLRLVDEIPYSTAKSKVRQRALAINLERPPTSKPGRKRKKTKAEFTTYYVVDLNTLAVFKHFYKKHRAPNGKMLVALYDDMLDEVFSSTDALGKVVCWDLARIPSRDQFKYWYRRIYSAEERRRAAVGDKQFDLDQRPVLGDSTINAPIAGAAAQIDATVWNADIVSRMTGRPIIGPPVVFRVRDNSTGMCLGLSVSLGSASWMGAASAVANCLEDKVKFCAKFGIDISPNAWPVKGLPGRLDADRGETEGFGPEPFIKLTDVQVRNVKPGRGDLKGGVESDWHTIQTRMTGETPGQIVQRYKENGGNDWRIKAALDIEQFTAVLILHELERMTQTRTGSTLTDSMIADGVDTSPLSMWNWSMSCGGGSLKQFELDEVQLALMPRDSASVTEHGLCFRGVYYSAPQIVSRGWFSKARTSKRWSVLIAWEPRLVDHIYLFDDTDRHVYIMCSLTNIRRQLAYRGKTFMEVKELQEREQENNMGRAQQKQQDKLDYKNKRKEILEQAIQQTADARAPDLSKASLTKNRRKNRKEENANYAPTLAFTPFNDEADERSSDNVIAFQSRERNDEVSIKSNAAQNLLRRLKLRKEE